MILLKQPSETLRHPLPVAGLSTVGAVHEVGVVARGLVPGARLLTAVPALFGGALTLVLDGGGDGERYLVTVLADDAAGSTREVEIEVAVIDHVWALPDGGAPMLSIARFVDRVGYDEVVRMTDTAGTGRIDRAYLVDALTDAQAQVEGYLAGRYALPLAAVPRLIEGAVADIACARLYRHRAPEGVAKAAADAVKLLERIAAGTIQLPPSAGGGAPEPATASDGPAVRPGISAYPDRLAGY